MESYVMPSAFAKKLFNRANQHAKFHHKQADPALGKQMKWTEDMGFVQEL
jgi:hypothetical protein